MKQFDLFPFFLCSECHTPLTIDEVTFSNYFFNNQKFCPHCQKQESKEYIWKSVLKAFSGNFGTFAKEGVSILIGCRMKAFKISMASNQWSTLNLLEYGIPAHAHIVSINLTPEGCIFPIWRSHSNQITPILKIPTTLELFGIPSQRSNLAEIENLQPILVNIAVTYSYHQEDDYFLPRLLNAFQLFLKHDYGLMAHEAHSVLENMLNILIANFAEKIKVSELQMKYEKKLTIKLREICSYLDIPDLEEGMREIILSLYKKRNERSHTVNPTELNFDSAAEFMCATIFTYHYMKLINEKLKVLDI